MTIDSLIFLFRGALAIAAIRLIFESTKAKGDESDKCMLTGLILLGVSLFIYGIQVVIGQSQPWSYLIAHGTASDWAKSIIGGGVMFLYPIGLYFILRKKIKKAFGDETNDSNSEQ